MNRGASFNAGATRRQSIRLAGEVLMLAGCQRVEYLGEWMEFSEYIEERLDTRSTYGMCP